MKQLYTFRHIRNINLRVSVTAVTVEQARLLMSDGVLHPEENWVLWSVGPVPADWNLK